MVEDPLIGRHAFGLGGVIENAVDVPANFAGLPFHGKGMVVVSHRIGQIVDAAEALAAGVAGTVDRAKDLVGLADVLHDVDLARLRPAGAVDVGAQAPEGRPQAAPRRTWRASTRP